MNVQSQALTPHILLLIIGRGRDFVHGFKVILLAFFSLKSLSSARSLFKKNFKVEL